MGDPQQVTVVSLVHPQDPDAFLLQVLVIAVVVPEGIVGLAEVVYLAGDRTAARNARSGGSCGGVRFLDGTERVKEVHRAVVPDGG